MTVHDFIRLTNPEIQGSNTVRPIAVCSDGFILSIQASKRHYSIPHNNPDVKNPEAYEYEKMEVGFRNHQDIPEWNEKYQREDWDESDSYAINCLYGFVCMNDLEELVKKHGGIISIDRRVTV